MEMKKVDSVSVMSIGHAPETSTLHITFHSGDTYAFHSVSAAKHQALLNAPSLGRHLNQVIKPNHRFTKVQEGK